MRKYMESYSKQERNGENMEPTVAATDTYYHVYYRIEAGYNGGNMSHEKCDTYHAEIKELFEDAGWTYEPGRQSGVAPTVSIGKTSLYCHPQSLSGPVSSDMLNNQTVESIIRDAETFDFEKTEIYEELKDWDDEAYFSYLKSIESQITADILRTCTTKRRNLCVNGDTVCWNVSIKFCVRRLRDYLGIRSGNPADIFVQKLFQQLVADGQIEELEMKKGGKGYRTTPKAHLT